MDDPYVTLCSFTGTDETRQSLDKMFRAAYEEERKWQMDNQHRQIKGYRELNEVEIGLMNKVKLKGLELQSLIDDLSQSEGDTKADPRWLAIGKTHLQEGLMALTRSIAKPDFF